MATNDFTLRKTIIDECTFKINNTFKVNKEKSDSKEKIPIALKVEVSANKLKNTDNTFLVNFNAKIGEESNKTPFYINILLHGVVVILNKDISQEIKTRILQNRVPEMLLGHVRSIVLFLTENSKYPRYNIPDIEFVEGNDS